MLQPVIFSILSFLLLYSIYFLQAYLNVVNLSHLQEFLKKTASTPTEIKQNPLH